MKRYYYSLGLLLLNLLPAMASDRHGKIYSVDGGGGGSTFLLLAAVVVFFIYIFIRNKNKD